MKCNCMIHRYHVAHICGCGRIISHSQADWDTHKNHAGVWVNFSPRLYAHGDSVEILRNKIAASEPKTPERGIDLAYAYGFLIGNMREHVTPVECFFLNWIADVKQCGHSYRADRVFESYAWKVRYRLENTGMY